MKTVKKTRIAPIDRKQFNSGGHKDKVVLFGLNPDEYKIGRSNTNDKGGTVLFKHQGKEELLEIKFKWKDNKVSGQ